MEKINRSIEDYSDIIDAARPELKHHKRMSESDRAAQFSSFAALSGFEEAVDETIRIETEKNQK